MIICGEPTSKTALTIRQYSSSSETEGTICDSQRAAFSAMVLTASAAELLEFIVSCSCLTPVHGSGQLWFLMDIPPCRERRSSCTASVLRHAVDADHIAAIDNVTRKLMQAGKRPVGIGFLFSLGRSTIVLAGAAGIAGMALTLQNPIPAIKSLGSVVGTLVLTLFLFGIAMVTIRSVRRLVLSNS
jgi:high-affinity nickel permease